MAKESEWGSFVNRWSKVAGRVCDSVCKDICALYERGEEKIEKLIDRVTEEDKLRGLGQKVFQHAKEGTERVKEELRASYRNYSAQLDDLVKSKPDVVGFWDGFVNAYLGTSCERRPRSEIYNMHVKYGKAVGWASAAVLFVSNLPFGKLVASVPVLSRTVRYLEGKVSEAKAEVGKSPANN